MALAPHNPLIIEDVSLTLDGTDYATAVDSVTLIPTTTKVAWKPVNGHKSTRVARPSWALTLNVGQDFDRAGLTHKLITDHGKEVPFTLLPNGESDTAAITGLVTLEAHQLGGGAETIATASVTLDVSGQPEFTWADTVPAAAAAS